MILHFTKDEKFIFDFISFIENERKSESHLFIVKKQLLFKIPNNKNIHFIKRTPFFNYLKYISKIYTCEKIIIHSLFDAQILLLLLLLPRCMQKSTWVVWGGDILSAEIGLKSYLKYALRRLVVKRIGSIVLYNTNEIKRIRHTYGQDISKKLKLSFFYPSNIAEKVINRRSDNLSNTTSLTIAIGHSGSSDLDHLHIFEILNEQHFGGKVRCYLAYGDRSYITKVKSSGREFFGERFQGIFNFVDKHEYFQSFHDVGLVIFHSDRPIGMGTIRNLLASEVPICVKKASSTHVYLEGLGFEVLTVEDIPSFTLGEKKINVVKNSKLATSIFSVAQLRDQHNEIFL